MCKWGEHTRATRKSNANTRSKASHIVNLHPQLLPKHLSNYRMSCSSQNLTLSGHWLACVQTFWSINALFTEKPISNSCRMISAVRFFLKQSVKLTLNTIWHTQQNRRLPPNGLAPCWAGPKAFYSNKSLFLVASKTLMCGWWDSTCIQAAVDPSNRHGNIELTQWRKSRLYKCSQCRCYSLCTEMLSLPHLNVVWFLSPPPKLLQIIKQMMHSQSTIHHTLKRWSVKYVETKLYRPTHLAPLPWFTGNALKKQNKTEQRWSRKQSRRGKERVQER